MTRYKEAEKQVFQWLMKKHAADPDFRFSLRQKGNKGAETDIFIGTEKSGYFGTTFWHIRVYFPGSSTDLINLMFTLVEGGYFYTFQFQQTKDPVDKQNRLALDLVMNIKKELKDQFSRTQEAEADNKMFRFYIYSPKNKYETVESMLLDVEKDLEIIMPIVDEQISKTKEDNPDFFAERYSEAAFNKMLSKFEQRQIKYGNKADNEIAIKQQTTMKQSEPKEEYFPLNQILYGPPGTGKTFNTINKAVAIANREFDIETASRTEIHAEYDRLVDEGSIQFCTFHQSMSYEDFIEGIKPLTKDGKVVYEVQSGLFKKICFKALEATAQENAETRQEATFDVLWKRFIEHLQKTVDANEYPFVTKENSELRPDRDELSKGRIVAYYRWGNASTKAEPGKTPFPIKPEKIKWMRDEGISDTEVNLRQRLQPVISYHLSPHYAVYKSFLAFLRSENIEITVSESSNDDLNVDTEEFNGYLDQLRIVKQKKVFIKKGKPFVLIIDEINRGNVSQIFGELITLLEEDKRFGQKEGITIKLPYSKDEEFAVPDNLYIIGTMNTADRSVEALDTALRRRFVFENMMPDSALLHPFALLSSFWNDERHIHLDYQKWLKEPYRTVADNFYELIGFNRETEEKMLSNVVDTERIYWAPEDFLEINDSLFDVGVRLDYLLTKINERIEKLLSSDQQIGHAFFINATSIDHLYEIFYDKLIPQLQEYFYGDFGKIGLILGKDFIQPKSSKTSFAEFTYDDKDLLLERKVYEVKTFKPGGELMQDEFIASVKKIYQ